MYALSPRMKRALELKKQGKTCREIGAELGCTSERARQLLAEGRRRSVPKKDGKMEQNVFSGGTE